MPARTYSVPDITCDHCKRSIEAEVGKVGDVDQVSVDIAKKTVRVEGSATDEAIRAAIEEAGYDIAGSFTG
jgi:copper chaperone CopZ